MSERFAQEPEEVRSRPVVVVTLGVLIATLLGSLIAYLILVGSIGTARLPSGEPEAPESLGVLHSSLINEEALRDRPTAEPPVYDDYAWVDEDAGVIQVPLDVAIEVYLEQHAAHAQRKGSEP